jgi:hypothetical protein
MPKGAFQSGTGRSGRKLLAILASSFILLEPARAADCNHNGLDDLAEVQSGRSPDCNENGVPDDCDLQPVNPVLAVAEVISTGGLGEPVEMRFADLDSDGELDLLGIFRSSPVMGVMLNDGRGSFAPLRRTPLDGNPAYLALADLDGDGDLDVALTSDDFPSDGTVLFNAGDGTFTVRTALPVEGIESRITAADLNGDGAPDLVLTRSLSPGLLVFRNLGSGSFSRSVILEEVEFTSLSSGDLDGDGDVDLAALTASGSMALLNDGAGRLSASPIAAGDSPSGLLLEDLDGDGDLDLAVAGKEDLQILQNRGNATFEPAVQGLSLAPSFSPYPDQNLQGMVAVDLDGDGMRDLLVLCIGQWNHAAISFLRNLGGGRFARGTIVAKVVPYSQALALFEPAAGGFLVAASRWNGADIALLRKGVGINSRDCNGNGVLDECDVASLEAVDCDRNGVPDSCQGDDDCDGNGLPDGCDLLQNRARDCNGNLVADTCDVARGVSADRGEDGIPDECQSAFSELFRLGFEGCPTRIQGAPREEKTFEVFATLEVQGNPGPDGPQGWAVSIAVEGAEVRSITLDGIHLSTIFDQDQDPLTPPLNPFDLDLRDAGFRIAQTAAGTLGGAAPPDAKGVVSAVVLNPQKKMVLQPNGTNRIARISLSVKVPPLGGAPATVRLRYQDGLRGSGGPVGNVITFGGASFSCQGERCAAETLAVQPFLRCDANDDLQVDIADPVWTLNELFGGANPQKTRCRLAADCNGDGVKDISDPIFGLSFLFTGGPRPPQPFPACGTGDESGSCDFGSTGCR